MKIQSLVLRGLANRQTDRQTDRQTQGQTDKHWALYITPWRGKYFTFNHVTTCAFVSTNFMQQN